MSPEQIKTSARGLARSLSSPQIVQLINDAQNEVLAEAELAKSHPLTNQQLDEKDFIELAKYLRDGGGVFDRRELAKSLSAALLSGKQTETFWPDLMHYLKSCLKGDGLIVALPDSPDRADGVEAPVVLHGVTPLGVDFKELSNKFRKVA